MSVQLTEGGILSFHCGKGYVGSILQITEVFMEGEAEEVIKPALSDGKYFSKKFFVRLSKQTEYIVQRLLPLSIIRIQEFTLSRLQEKKHFEILKFEVLQQTTPVSRVIGTPIEFNSTVGRADMDNFGFFPMHEIHPYMTNFQAIRGRIFHMSEKLTYDNDRGSGFFYVYYFGNNDTEVKMTHFNGQQPIIDIQGYPLKEGKMYSVRKFDVQASRYQSTVHNKNEIIINKTTVFERLENDQSIRRHCFNFTSLADIEKNVANQTLVDFIGVCVGAFDPKDIPGKESGEHCIRTVVLCDDNNLSIKVELWNTLACEKDANYKHINKVIAIRSAVVTNFHGKTLRVAKTGYITIEPAIPRSEELRCWFKNMSQRLFRSISDPIILEAHEMEDDTPQHPDNQQKQEDESLANDESYLDEINSIVFSQSVQQEFESAWGDNE